MQQGTELPPDISPSYTLTHRRPQPRKAEYLTVTLALNTFGGRNYAITAHLEYQPKIDIDLSGMYVRRLRYTVSST